MVWEVGGGGVWQLAIRGEEGPFDVFWFEGKKVMRKFTKIYFLKFQISIKILKKYFISLNDNKVPPIPSDMEICKLQLVWSPLNWRPPYPQRSNLFCNLGTQDHIFQSGGIINQMFKKNLPVSPFFSSFKKNHIKLDLKLYIA